MLRPRRRSAQRAQPDDRRRHLDGRHKGSGGGFIGINGNDATVTQNFTVSAYVNAAMLTADQNVSITSTSTSNSGGSTQNGTGGFIALGNTNTNVNITNNNSRLRRPRQHEYRCRQSDFTLQGKTTNNLGTISASSSAGGFASSVNANAFASDGFSTTATIGQNDCISAGNDLSVGANTDTTGNTTAYANGIGFGGGGYANSGISIPGLRQTETEVQQSSQPGCGLGPPPRDELRTLTLIRTPRAMVRGVGASRTTAPRSTPRSPTP